MSAIVCPVNCQGVMGAGLAKQFRDNYINHGYQAACQRGEMSPGSVYVRQPLHVWSDTTKHLIYVATKNEWKEPSQLDWIKMGCENLVKALDHYGISSVAIPALGAGLGGLEWAPVEVVMKTVFQNDRQSKTIEVYLPR